ncbi:MAG: SPOR domain-containing protein [Proteobacteria bacterium]|nr:SPOR domain-containing protein [Pseudomonadota bacterium]
MPSFERGVYEPKSDDVRVFDEDEQEIDEEGSRLPLLIVIALLVLAAFGGVVWLAYSQGVQRGRADAPRMIVAAPGPVKEAAAGSTDMAHPLKIYEQPAPAEDDLADSDSVPPPPTAVTKPAPPPTATKPETKPVTKPAAAAAKAAEAVKAPEAKPVVKPAATKPMETKAPAAQSKAVETATLPPPATTPKPAEAASTAGGAYVLQIGAYKSQADADTAWKSFKAKHPMAAGYSEDVRKADLGDKGTWYRLRMGSFTDKAAAASFCEKLKSDGGNCLVAK